jgi:hypothetical protein
LSRMSAHGPAGAVTLSCGLHAGGQTRVEATTKVVGVVVGMVGVGVSNTSEWGVDPAALAEYAPESRLVESIGPEVGDTMVGRPPEAATSARIAGWFRDPGGPAEEACSDPANIGDRSKTATRTIAAGRSRMRAVPAIPVHDGPSVLIDSHRRKGREKGKGRILPMLVFLAAECVLLGFKIAGA